MCGPIKRFFLPLEAAKKWGRRASVSCFYNLVFIEKCAIQKISLFMCKISQW
ncbi:hypothetical protein MtrunA17_Chr1g0165391 [Medicago truncatula]|uniref:Uncharacterized protein n=1 Tax=Medicago truncatula TaxID=3880 RepID=A0A396JQA7_MEDTR|nr:hypothetical protein MtrunA17_Chr1g0165391 [Medicago truncatula]